MSDPGTVMKAQLACQVAHWSTAAERLQVLEDLASVSAWSSLESYLGMAIRGHLSRAIGQLIREVTLMQATLAATTESARLPEVHRQLLSLRKRYLRVETTLDFFADAINTRTSPNIARLLMACDTLAYRSMTQLLDPLGKAAPVVLTYLDKGLGASILKAGMRLWDGTSVNPVAAIKVTRHNLYRPTSIIHEAGHQVAHIVGWNEELATTLRNGLGDTSDLLADMWASWASEIAADAFAFVHTGYASVAALRDVVDGGPGTVFRHVSGDPHPIAYLRVLLGVEMCHQFYGAGPWDDLSLDWTEQYPLSKSNPEIRPLLQASLQLLPHIVHFTLGTPMRAFAGSSLASHINPERVKPVTLFALEKQLGQSLYTSMHWILTEALRLLALTGLRKATMPDQTAEMLRSQDQWMLRLGGALQAA